MKIFITFFLVFSFCIANAQIVRTIHQTFKQDEISMIQLDFDSNMEVEKWEGSRILVETTVSLEGANKNIIEHLIEAGRYKLINDLQGSTLHLNFHNINKKVLVRNVELVENIKLKVFVPEGMNIVQPVASR